MRFSSTVRNHKASQMDQIQHWSETLVSGVTKTVNLALYALNLLIFVLKQNGRGILALYHAAITERLKIMY